MYSVFKYTVPLTEEMQIWHVQMIHVNLTLCSDLVTYRNFPCFLYIVFFNFMYFKVFLKVFPNVQHSPSVNQACNFINSHMAAV